VAALLQYLLQELAKKCVWEGGMPPPVSTTYAKHYPIDSGNNSVPIQKVTKSKLMIDPS